MRRNRCRRQGHRRQSPQEVKSQGLQDVPQRLEVAAHLLDGHHVEARQDLRDRAGVGEVAFGRVVLRGLPALGQASQRADVPGRDEQVAVQVLGGHGRVQAVRELAELALDRRRRGVEDRGLRAHRRWRTTCRRLSRRRSPTDARSAAVRLKAPRSRWPGVLAAAQLGGSMQGSEVAIAPDPAIGETPPAAPRSPRRPTPTRSFATACLRSAHAPGWPSGSTLHHRRRYRRAPSKARVDTAPQHRRDREGPQPRVDGASAMDRTAGPPGTRDGCRRRSPRSAHRRSSAQTPGAGGQRTRASREAHADGFTSRLDLG
jgi:hypothetical protein